MFWSKKQSVEVIRLQLLYTVISITLILTIVTVVSIFGIRSYFPPGMTISRVLYATLGVVAMFLIDPLRLFIQWIVERISGRQLVDYEQLQATVSNILIAEKDIFTISQELCSELRKRFYVNDVQLVIRLGGTDFFQLENGKEVHVPANDALLLHLIEEPEEQLHRHSTDAHDHSDLEPYFEEHGIVYVLPLIIGQKLFGWISLHGDRNRMKLSIADKHTLHNIQPLIAVGIRRFRVAQKLHNRIEEIEALNRINQTMNSSLSVDETLYTVMDAVVELAHVDRAIMFLVDEETQTATPGFGRGLAKDIDLNYTIDLKKSVFKHVIDSREPLIVENALSDPRVNPDYVAQVKTKSFAAIPMVYKEKVIGIIGVDNLTSGQPVTRINVELLETLSHQAAIALVNSRLFERSEQFNDELQRKIHEATQHLELLLEMKSHFLTVASHQLRTPTTIIRGLLSMIVEDPDLPEEEMRKYIAQSYTTVNRLERIISELLSATELEDESIKPYVEKVQVAEFLHDILAEMESFAQQRDVQMHLIEPIPVPIILSDQFKLREALMNIIDNAIRYSQGGSVTIDIEKDEEQVTFYVIDTGVGMSEEDQQVIFDKFRRGSTISQIEPNGSGLGLFITKRIAEILLGTVTVISEGEGKGTTFILSVPLHLGKALVIADESLRDIRI